MSRISEAIILAKDVRHLGVPIIGRFITKTTSNGLKRISTRHGDFWIRPLETDLPLIRQIHYENSYDFTKFPQGEAIQARYDDILEHGQVPVVVDAGANIGVSSRYFTTAFPKARVFAIEPDPSTVAVCRLNTEMMPQIEVIEAALGSEPGRVAVEQFEGYSWATQTSRAETGLEIITIPDIVDKVPEGVLFIVKIDVEGFESDIFRTSTEWIDEAFVVLVEPHDWMFPGKGTSRSLQTAMASRDRELIISGENLVWIKR